MRRRLWWLLPLFVALLLTGCQQAAPESLAVTPTAILTSQEDAPREAGVYTTASEVAAYLHAYGRLPDNFITKAQARALGWPGGDLRPYAPGKTIGGDRFGNYEGILPQKQGRQYFECDIDTLNKENRGAKRLVYSSDGLIYYTEDHYASFVLLYGEDDGAAD